MLEEQRIGKSFEMEVAIGHNRWQVKRGEKDLSYFIKINLKIYITVCKIDSNREFAIVEDTFVADPESLLHDLLQPGWAVSSTHMARADLWVIRG